MNTLHGAEYGYHMLSPLPGTELYERPADYDLRILTSDWAEFDANRPIVETPTMSAGMAARAMADYDEVIEQVWCDIRRSAEAGDERSIARLEDKESREFIWSLLQGDVIDTPMAVDVTRGLDPGEAERELVGRIARAQGQPRELVQRQLRKLIERDLLQVHREGGGFCWQWREGPGTTQAGRSHDHRPGL